MLAKCEILWHKIARSTPPCTNANEKRPWISAKLLCRVTWVVLPRNEEISSAQGVITRGRPEYTARSIRSRRPLVMSPYALLISSFLGSTTRHRRPVCTYRTVPYRVRLVYAFRDILWRNPLAIGHIFSLNKFNCQTRTSLRSVLEVFPPQGRAQRVLEHYILFLGGTIWVGDRDNFFFFFGNFHKNFRVGGFKLGSVGNRKHNYFFFWPNWMTVLFFIFLSSYSVMSMRGRWRLGRATTTDREGRGLIRVLTMMTRELTFA